MYNISQNILASVGWFDWDFFHEVKLAFLGDTGVIRKYSVRESKKFLVCAVWDPWK